MNNHSSRIVVVGGGKGSSNLMKGLKRYTSNLTAIVTMFDSGGSSGLLRQEFGLPPLGDLRQCLLALGEDTEETRPMREAMEYRFDDESSLNGHSVGNLFMAALTSRNNNIERSIEDLGRLLRVKGQVIPVTLERADLCAELEDGSVIQGESDIDLRQSPLPRVECIFLVPEVEANPRAIQAIMEADAVVLGPGDLYTSILPNLLPKGIPEAIANSDALCIYISNLMTKLGETDDFKASRFVGEVVKYMNPGKLDWAIINTHMPSDSVRKAYTAEHAYAVEFDLEDVRRQVTGIVAATLAKGILPLRHDPDLTASAVLQVMDTGRLVSLSGPF